MNQNPEQLARDKIDQMLVDAGWLVQSKDKVNLTNDLKNPENDLMSINKIYKKWQLIDGEKSSKENQLIRMYMAKVLIHIANTNYVRKCLYTLN